MTNHEFLEMMRTCGKIGKLDWDDENLLCNSKVNIQEAYRRLKRFMDKYIAHDDSFDMVLWICLLSFGRIGRDHYYNGDYLDILDTILKTYVLLFSDKWLKRRANLVNEFMLCNNSNVYEIELKDIKRKTIINSARYKDNVIELKCTMGETSHLRLNNGIRCSYITIKDGKLDYEPYKDDDCIKIIDKVLGEDDYDLIYIHNLNYEVEKILKHYKDKNVDNRTYFKIMKLLDLVNNDNSRLWKRMDDILGCEYDLKTSLNHVFGLYGVDTNRITFSEIIDVLYRAVTIQSKKLIGHDKKEIEASIEQKVLLELKKRFD